MVMVMVMMEAQHGMESSEKGEVSDGIGDSDGNDGDDDDENGSPTWCSELDVVSDGDDGDGDDGCDDNGGDGNCTCS